MKIFSLFIILFFPIFISCESPAGHHGVSYNIRESKERGVFISEYKVSQNPYFINDTLKILVKEAWLEKHWAYGENKDQTVLYPTENYQLCINTIEDNIKYVDLDWTVGITVDLCMRGSGYNSLIGDFKKMPADTIEYKVQQGDDLSDNGEKIIIGKFVLIKKK